MHLSLSRNWNTRALNLEQMQLRAITKQTVSLKDNYKIWATIPHKALLNKTASCSHMTLIGKYIFMGYNAKT